MAVGARGTSSFGLRIRSGLTGLSRSSLQPAHGQASRSAFQAIAPLRPSLHSMISRSPSRRRAVGTTGSLIQTPPRGHGVHYRTDGTDKTYLSHRSYQSVAEPASRKNARTASVFG